MKLLAIIFLANLIFSVNTSYPREPDVLPRHYDYGERITVGGSEWSGGDTFIAIALPIAVVMLIALPQIFSGNNAILCWDEQIPRNISERPHYRQVQLFPLLESSPRTLVDFLRISELPTGSLCVFWKRQRPYMVTLAFGAFSYSAYSEHGCKFGDYSADYLTRSHQYDRFGGDRRIGDLVLHDAYKWGDDLSDFCESLFWHTTTNFHPDSKYATSTDSTTRNQHRPQGRIYPVLKESFSWMKYSQYNLKSQEANA